MRGKKWNLHGVACQVFTVSLMCVHHCEKLYTAVIIGEKLGQSYTKQQKKRKKKKKGHLH